MKYKYMQFIGVLENTGIPIPVPQTASTDEQNRINYFLSIIEKAYGYASPEANILKICIAPEFFFRPASNEGKYAPWRVYDVESYKFILDSLRTLFADEKYRDWVIIPGTILALADGRKLATDKVLIDILKGEFVMPKASMRRSLPSPDMFYLNTAPVIKGGPDGFIRYVHKVLNPLDGEADGDYNQTLFGNQHVKPLQLSWNLLRQHIFEVEGLTFGLEICLESTKYEPSVVGPDVLRYVLRNWEKNGETTPRPQLDFQIHTSCGNTPNVCVCRKGGYVLWVEGKPEKAHMWECVKPLTKEEETINFIENMYKQDSINGNRMGKIVIYDQCLI